MTANLNSDFISSVKQLCPISLTLSSVTVFSPLAIPDQDDQG